MGASKSRQTQNWTNDRADIRKPKLKANLSRQAIAMRSCKTDQSFTAFISLAATMIKLR